MVWQALIPAAASVVGGVMADRGARRAGEIQAGSAAEAGRLGAEAAAIIREDLRPYSEGGQAAQSELLDFLGLPQVAARGSPSDTFRRINEIPKGGVVNGDQVGLAFETFVGRPPTERELNYYTGKRSDPGSPLRARGNELWNDIINPNISKLEALEQAGPARPTRSAADAQMEYLRNHPLFALGLENLNEQDNAFAASRGRFGTGDTATEIFNNAMAAGSPLLEQRYRQLFNLTTMGQNAAAQRGTATLTGADTMGNALLAGGNAQASALLGQTQARQNALSGVVNQLPAIIEMFQNRGQPPALSGDYGGDTYYYDPMGRYG